jgi:5,10-methylenetetrahydromethanopterin reductase
VRLFGALASYTLAVSVPQFALNRFDARSVPAFAEDVRRAELLGWDAAFQPDSQLRRRDTYVLLAAAANATSRIWLAPFIANPVTRHPSVTASSIATIDELAPGRVLLALGIGDTAVRLSGLRPARVAELEAAALTIKGLLAGKALDVGAAQLAYLPHHRPVPVWIAAGGPRTLRMAGAVADGVFIRAGTSSANIGAAVEEIRTGAVSAGRELGSVRLGIVFHTVLVDDPEAALTMAKSIAAGYYDDTPGLFSTAGLKWEGPTPGELKITRGIWPDFHHASNLVTSGQTVDFLPREVANLFSLWGTAQQIASQLIAVLSAAPAQFDFVVLQPIPDPIWPSDGHPDYTERMATDVLPVVRAALRRDEPG